MNPNEKIRLAEALLDIIKDLEPDADEVCTESSLEAWAKDNGFVKESEIES